MKGVGMHFRGVDRFSQEEARADRRAESPYGIRVHSRRAR